MKKYLQDDWQGNMIIASACLTSKGGRKTNEDSYARAKNAGAYLYVLADGLGGHDCGELASQLVVGTMVQAFESGERDLATLIQGAQDALLEEQQRLNLAEEMKTTVVCLIIAGGYASWAHVGDSRLYWFVGDTINLHSLDHSVPQVLATSGEIREEDIRHHEDRNRLTRVMGMEWTKPRYDLSERYKIVEDCAFLLCSDGFWEWVSDEEMTEGLKASPDPRAWLIKMAEESKKACTDKTRDNYSAIAVYLKATK